MTTTNRFTWTYISNTNIFTNRLTDTNINRTNRFTCIRATTKNLTNRISTDSFIWADISTSKTSTNGLIWRKITNKYEYL